MIILLLAILIAVLFLTEGGRALMAIVATLAFALVVFGVVVLVVLGVGIGIVSMFA